MTLPVNTVLQGNCLEVLKTFPGQSIDFVMTSPPYYGLRDYANEFTSLVWGGEEKCEHQWKEEEHKFHSGTSAGEKQLTNRGTFHTDFSSHSRFCALCGAWKGQLGLEPTWQMYVQHISLICTEIKRVLRKSGSFYLVMGDTFAGSRCGDPKHTSESLAKGQQYIRQEGYLQIDKKGLPPKCLMGIPWRVAFAVIEKGWILRNAIIWHKPNAMPSSVKDRLAQTYEYIFHLVKSNRYYYNLDAVREQHQTSSFNRLRYPTSCPKADEVLKNPHWRQTGINAWRPPKIVLNPLGKNPGDTVATEPSKGSSFNLRLRDAIRGKAGVSAFEEVGFRKGEKERLGYATKYKDQGNGQTLQGLPRGQTQFQERLDSHTVAKELFPNDPQKQQEYINYVHDHGTNPMGKNPGDVLTVQPEGHGHDRWAGQRGEGLRPWNERFHPKGKNPGDVLRIGVHHGSSVTTGRAAYYQNQKVESALEGKNPGDFWSIMAKGFKGHHYAVYPERICVRPMLAACPSDGIVLDPMAGSGTTLIVAKKLGRKWIGIELNPDFIEIIKRRLATIPEKLDRYFK